MYGQDDWALLASTVAAVGQYTALLAALSNGLGKSFILLSTDQISIIEKVPMQQAPYRSFNGTERLTESQVHYCIYRLVHTGAFFIEGLDSSPHPAIV